MRIKMLTTMMSAAALVALAPTAASAQDMATENGTYQAQPQQEDNDFPWGLLGLLGLAGLLGRKRNDTVHVDNRTRP